MSKKTEKLLAITPIDGRYRDKVEIFRGIFSEFGLQKYRTEVELLWLFFLGQKLRFFSIENHEIFLIKKTILKNFSVKSAERIKDLEKTTNHDVKAVEYFICEKLRELNLEHLCQWVHFSLTSEDITNGAIAKMLLAGHRIIKEELNDMIDRIETLGQQHKAVPMMSHTHGQPASPTTVGKEFINFAAMLKQEFESLSRQKFYVKSNGASGNYNAHTAAFPDVNWIQVSTDFINDYLGMKPNLYTVQTNSYNYISELCHNLARISSIIVNLDRDMWEYISRRYFSQKMKEGEVGSSTMPHKVNPIDFENSEGNAEMSVVMFNFFADKLLKTRMQRDLTDSTDLRNLGIPFSWLLISIKSSLRGLGKIQINEKALLEDLAANPELLAEPIQTVLRTRGASDAYERLKKLTRGAEVTKEDLIEFIKTQSEFSPEDVKRLIALTPATYIGKAVELVDHYFKNLYE